MDVISNMLNIGNIVGDSYLSIKTINNTIGAILSAMVAYRVIFTIIGLFWTRKFKPAKKKHKYAICIAARNEETVIGNLLDSIK
jgi:hypothetical protein